MGSSYLVFGGATFTVPIICGGNSPTFILWIQILFLYLYMALSLVKGKLRQILNKAYKSSDYICSFHGMAELPVRVTNVRMYVDNTIPQQWDARYQFEIDLEVTIPTYEGSLGLFRYGADRNIVKAVKSRIHWCGIMDSLIMRSSMFTAHISNYVKVKKISIIRNSTPPSLNN
jgi:hypothetical protein